MASSLATGAKVSSKYIPSCWQLPLATNLALFLTTMPFSSILFLNTHLVSIRFFPLGLGTSFQTLFLSNWFSSSCIAKIQSRSNKASSTFFGSSLKRKLLYRHSSWFSLLVWTLEETSPIMSSNGWSFVHFLCWGRLALDEEASLLSWCVIEFWLLETPPEFVDL